MRGVASDKAAIAIKKSCLRAVEVPLPTEAVSALSTKSRASYDQALAPPGGGLRISLNNESGYTLTELTISVYDKNNPADQDRYTVNRFWQLPHQTLQPNQTAESGMYEIIVPIGKWDQSSTWGIVAAKGFPTVSNQANSIRAAVVQTQPFDANLYDPCKAYEDVLRADPTAEIAPDKARKASVCSGYLAGFVQATPYTYSGSPPHTQIFTSKDSPTSKGIQWCWPLIDNKSATPTVMRTYWLEMVSNFVKYLEEKTAMAETLLWPVPSFPRAMNKYYPCGKSP